MKRLAFILLISFFIIGCQQNKDNSKASSETTTEKEVSLLKEIAFANGFDNWSKVNSISYTFNAQNGENSSQRAWTWKPKTGEVKMQSKDTTLTYKTANFDEEIAFADRGFVNDKYWLLFPFHLVWDENFDHEVKADIEAPISGKPMQEIAVIYKNKAGYTPGDTYHIYVDEDKMIREWTYTPSGSEVPRLATTWEDYKEFKGIKIAKMHNSKAGNFKIFFTDISVK